MPQIKLIDNPRLPWNTWRSHNATELRLEWVRTQISFAFNLNLGTSQLDNGHQRKSEHQTLGLLGGKSQRFFSKLNLIQDTDDHRFEEVGTISEQTENDGLYMFDPHTISRQQMVSPNSLYNHLVPELSKNI
jgi:hypothetical protein